MSCIIQNPGSTISVTVSTNSTKTAAKCEKSFGVSSLKVSFNPGATLPVHLACPRNKTDVHADRYIQVVNASYDGTDETDRFQLACDYNSTCDLTYRASPCYSSNATDNCSLDISYRCRIRGQSVSASALNGTKKSMYYQTPYNLFIDEVHQDPADTGQDGVCVLDKYGIERFVRSSGLTTILPEMRDVNATLRTRFPVYPIHEHGSSLWKEVSAIQKLSNSYPGNDISSDTSYQPITLLLEAGITGHTHTIALTSTQTTALHEMSQSVTTSSSLDDGHTHDITLTYAGGEYFYTHISPYEEHGDVVVGTE